MAIAVVSASIWPAANLLAEWKFVSLTAVGDAGRSTGAHTPVNILL